MRRICVFCEKWASGGIESFLTSVLTKIEKSNMEIDIVATCIKKSVFTSLLIEHGVHFRELSGNRNCIVKNSKLFLNILKERHYDVIHLNVFHGGALFYLLLAHKMGVAIRIVHSHNAGLRRGKYYWLKLMIHRWASKHYIAKATDLWACSSAAADFMFPHGVPFRLIPNGFDTKRFKFDLKHRNLMRQQLGIKDEIVVGNVGRLCYQKNQTFLLRVFAEFLKVRPNSRLILVGEGEDRDKLQKEAALLCITDKVNFWGTTDHVEQFYWAMDVFVFPSIFEGLGIAVVEAQAAGLPVICSDSIPKEACILNSVKKVPLRFGVDKWVEALEDSQRSMHSREACAAIVQKNGFDIEDVVKQVAEKYLR